MHPKEADAIANSIDPDQTASSEAVWSWSALFAETYLSQYMYIEFLRYFLSCHSANNIKFACNIFEAGIESVFYKLEAHCLWWLR